MIPMTTFASVKILAASLFANFRVRANILGGVHSSCTRNALVIGSSLLLQTGSDDECIWTSKEEGRLEKKTGWEILVKKTFIIAETLSTCLTKLFETDQII